jgi:DNA-binding response OmpR family regulator
MKEIYHILIIDDSSTALLLMEYALNEEGYIAHAASSVNDALIYLKQNTPDLVLLDLSMPEISGYDFLKMRKELQLADTPIIVVSAFDADDTIRETLSLGAIDFISKPIHIDTLLAKIKANLKS